MISAAELAALRADMALAFTTPATIKRVLRGSDVLGDDAGGDPETIGSVLGWLSSSPTPEATNDGGIVTANTFRFDCAVGTDIRPRDTLVIGGNKYVVSDTTADETIAICLSCSLRFRE